MNVAEHRTPLKRIEIGSPIMPRRRPYDVVIEAMSGVGPTERDRIWGLVEQTARGVNAPTQPVAPAYEPAGVLLSDDIAEAVRGWLMGGDA
jgi:hypothetical protein